MDFQHVSVMPAEVQQHLDLQPGERCVDATVGGAGHAKAICQSIYPDGLFIGLDRDRAAIDCAHRALSSFMPMVKLFRANFIDLPEILTELNIDQVDAVVVDLGMSFYQLHQSGRGFSFQNNEPLDMRMGLNDGPTAADIINHSSPKELRQIFKTYGEERWADRIVKAITVARKQAPIVTTRGLTGIVVQAVPKARQPQRIHPATRIFMALRIAVNRELHCLKTFLTFVPDILKRGGRLCMIAFHSLEDRMIKRRFRELAQGCTCPPDFPMCICDNKAKVKLLTPKVVRPGPNEVSANPMARSARLRALIRV